MTGDKWRLLAIAWPGQVLERFEDIAAFVLFAVVASYTFRGQNGGDVADETNCRNGGGGGVKTHDKESNAETQRPRDAKSSKNSAK
jgi:hypothetical protein